LDISEIELKVLDFEDNIGHTMYKVQTFLVSSSQTFMMQTRYTEFAALDIVLSKKYKNLSFPALPGKHLWMNKKRKKERADYLRETLDLILQYAR
jgi:hypothetical protein